MASPLILRITSTFDSGGTKRAAKEFSDLGKAISSTGNSTSRTVGDFERLSAEVTTLGNNKEPLKPLTDGSASLRQEMTSLVGMFRMVRRVAFIGTFLATPFIIATKSIIELEQALQPLNTTLTQLGQNSSVQQAAIVSFAKSLELTSGTKLAESLGGLQAYIKATKDSSESVLALSTAETLHFATGQKVAAILTALGQAQTGNVESLANLTDKRKEDIFELVQQGKLLSELRREFAGPAAEGASSFGAALSAVTNKFKAFGTEASKVFLKTNWILGPQLFETQIKNSMLRAKTEVERFNTVLTKASDPNKKFNLGTFDDSLRTLGKLKGEIQTIQDILSTRKLDRIDIQGLVKNKSLKEQEVRLVEEQLAFERELPTAQRAVLAAQTAINQNQLNFIKNKSRLDITGRGISSSKTRIQQELIQEETLAKQKLAIDEARQKAQVIREQHNGKIAKELELNIQKELELKLLSIIEEGQKKLDDSKQKELQTTIQISQTQLEIFRRTEESKLVITKKTLRDRIDEEQKVSKQITEKQIQIIIQQKQLERDTLLAQGNLTNQQELRLAIELQNEIAKVRESAAISESTKQIKSALLTTLEQAAIKKHEEEVIKYQEIVANIGVGGLTTVQKTTIRNLKLQDDLIQAQTRFNQKKTGVSPTFESEAFTKETDKLLGEQSTKSIKAQTDATLTAQTQALAKFNTDLEAQLQGIAAKERILPITVRPQLDLESLDPISQAIAKAILKSLAEAATKAVSEQQGQALIQPAEQAG